MTDVATVGVDVVLETDPVSKILNGTLSTEDRNGKIDSDQNGKSHDQNGKDVAVEVKDGSEDGTEDNSTSDDFTDRPRERHRGQLVADDRNGHGPQREEEEEEEEEVVEEEGDVDDHQDPEMKQEPDAEESASNTTVHIEMDHAPYVPTDSRYVTLLMDKERSTKDREAMNNHLEAFKRTVICNLRDIKEEYTRQSNKKLKDLQNKYNSACQARNKQQKEKEKAIKERDNERKQSNRKDNDYKQDLMRRSKEVDKVKAEAKTEYDRLQRRYDDLQKDQEKSVEKVKRTEELVETVRKEKQSVTEQNTVYLRNEKTKMRRELDKERVNRRQLEDQVNELLDDKERKSSDLQLQHNRYTVAERKGKIEQLRADKACKERDDAVQSLHSKNRLIKQQQATIDDLQIQMELKEEHSVMQKKSVRSLQEAVRRKSEFEREYDVHKKKLRERELKLNEREKQLDQKAKKQNSSRRTHNYASTSPSKRPKQTNTRPSVSPQFGDPLHHIRNILPFHWLSLLLLVLLMISIAQKR